MNKIILMGRLTRDPEMRTTQGGKTVARMSLAVDRPKGKNQEDKKTDFFTLVAWEDLARVFEKYCGKGRKILIEGHVEQRKYQAKDGSDRVTYEVVVEKMEFAESKKADEGNNQSAAQQPATDYGASYGGGYEQQSAYGYSAIDEDVPF